MMSFLREEAGAVAGRCVWAFILLGGPAMAICGLFYLSQILGG